MVPGPHLLPSLPGSPWGVAGGPPGRLPQGLLPWNSPSGWSRDRPGPRRVGEGSAWPGCAQGRAVQTWPRFPQEQGRGCQEAGDSWGSEGAGLRARARDTGRDGETQGTDSRPRGPHFGGSPVILPWSPPVPLQSCSRCRGWLSLAASAHGASEGPCPPALPSLLPVSPRRLAVPGSPSPCLSPHCSLVPAPAPQGHSVPVPSLTPVSLGLLRG